MLSLIVKDTIVSSGVMSTVVPIVGTVPWINRTVIPTIRTIQCLTNCIATQMAHMPRTFRLRKTNAWYGK